MKIPVELRNLIEAGTPAHLVTLNPDGSPQVTVVWIGLEGDEIVAGHLPRNRKVRNIEKDGRRTVTQFLSSNPHSFPILLDEQEVVQRRYGVYKFPESFIVRKDGVIDDKVIGAIDWAEPRTVAYFRDLLLR